MRARFDKAIEDKHVNKHAGYGRDTTLPRAVVVTSRQALAFMFFVTAFWKALALDASITGVQEMLFLGRSSALCFVVGIVGIESLLALFLLFHFWSTVAALGSLMFSVGAALMHVYLLWFGVLEPCGCSGRVIGTADASHAFSLLIAIVMAFLSTIIVVDECGRWG
jgi:hypothetical protein